MKKQEVTDLVRQIFKEEITPTFLAMLHESESRITSMNDMMQKLVSACHDNQLMYDKHLSSLEQSRDRAQQQVSDMIKSNMALEANATATINSLREDSRYIVQGYKDELKSAKQMVNHANDALMRMAESGKSSSQGNKTEVTIGK